MSFLHAESPAVITTFFIKQKKDVLTCQFQGKSLNQKQFQETSKNIFEAGGQRTEIQLNIENSVLTINYSTIKSVFHFWH